MGWNAACTSNPSRTFERDPEGLLTCPFNLNGAKLAALSGQTIGQPASAADA
jgi:hypothetical protein